MKILLQRVSQASVRVGDRLISRIGEGLLLLVGVGAGDDDTKFKSLAEKIVNLRIFPDERGRFHHSLLDTGGELLLVSQFTLFADTSKGRRPEFFGAMAPHEARLLFDRGVQLFQGLGVKSVKVGEFGSHMQVDLINDGPVTMLLESP